MTKEIKIRNVPDFVFIKLNEMYHSSTETSFNKFMVAALENYASQNEFQSTIKEYTDRQNTLIEIVNRNTQVINLILSHVEVERGISNEKKDNSDEAGDLE